MAPTDPYIERYIIDLRERGCTDATIEGYRKNLTRADRELPEGLQDANSVELKAWVHREDLSQASKRAYDAALRGYFAWRERLGLLEWNPMSQLVAPKVPEGLPNVAADEQVRWAVHETPEPLRTWAILAAYGGLRCLEISRLHRGHVDEQTISVHRGKGNKSRRVPTHPLVWAAVRDLPAGPITDLTRQQISLNFWRYARRCGLREMGMHRLRGWFCTNGYSATKDLLAMQRSMGHAKPDQTARYVKLTEAQVRAVVDGLPVFG